jgi:hypothetical protein
MNTTTTETAAFVPTHAILQDDLAVVPVHYDADLGALYTEAEWETESAADYELSDGNVLFQGEETGAALVDLRDNELRDYETGESIRPATPKEALRSVVASTTDGGVGVIRVNRRRCYVA